MHEPTGHNHPYDLDTEIARRAHEILDYEFREPRLLAESLTHSSIAENRVHSNERMEFLGDAILGAVVCEYLFHTYQDYLEGELTKIKSTVVSRRTCARMSNELGLTDLMTLGKGMSRRPTLPMSLAAAVFESVVAAIYLDGGIEPARAFILRHIAPHIEQAAESTHQRNFKSALQQHAQKHLADLPDYVLLAEKGPDHSKKFQVRVELGERAFDAAWGDSKKQAEQKAALQAMREMDLARVDEQGEVHLEEDAL